MVIETGNFDQINKDNPNFRDWVIGDFISKVSLRHSELCEVKWTRWKKGKKRPSAMDIDSPSVTVGILIFGQVKITDLRTGEEVILKKSGDYIAITEDPHITEALEDLLMVSIRWKTYETK